MIPIFSVIIPCYNHGEYLDDIIRCLNHNNVTYPYECLIVNDGSTDLFTLNKLKDLSNLGYTVLHQNNLGLATARNNGIKASKGKYILPLDADNKIDLGVFSEAISYMECDQTISVVYTNLQQFGEKNVLKKPGKFDHLRLLNKNYIDACAVYRREVFILTGGYDAQMPTVGHEDWEFWLSAYFVNAKFLYLNKIGVFYRVTSNSMSSNFTINTLKNNRRYIFNKHATEIAECYHEMFSTYLKNQRKIQKILKNLKDSKFRLLMKILLGKNIFE